MIGRGLPALPDGYVQFRLGNADVACLAPLASAIREAFDEDATLYDYARRHPQAKSYLGRGVSYAVPLPGNAARVVVRHSRHGGLLAPITGDRFLAPTRAPRELLAAHRLTAAKIPTPEVVAFATYRAGLLFRRSDIATREISPARDLGMLLLAPASPEARAEALRATRELLAAMGRAGARHPDFNLKNVLIAPRRGVTTAWVLDVDTVRFDEPGATVARANAERLTRSLRKWRRLYGLEISDPELATLEGVLQ